MSRRSTTRSRRPRRASATSSASRKGSGKLRIIGGEYRRRWLPILDSPGLRPTPDRVRETLFNWLTTACPGGRVLDLYAGTGALGLEALSRGAHEATFIERSATVASTLEQNLATLGANGRVIVTEAEAFLTNPPSPFDLVFLDPPFRQGLAEPSCIALETHGWLADDAYVYVETEHQLIPRVPANWRLHREVKAGDSTGRLFHRMASPASDGC